NDLSMPPQLCTSKNLLYSTTCSFGHSSASPSPRGIKAHSAVPDMGTAPVRASSRTRLRIMNAPRHRLGGLRRSGLLISPFQSATIEPPRDHRQQNERTRSQEHDKVRTQISQMAKVMGKLHPLFGGPANAIALLHEQRHQAVNAKNRCANAVSFSL